MQRRTVLKGLAAAAAAAWMLPSCIADPRKVSIALNNLSVTGDEEDLLAAIAEAIIPETDTPGAKTVAAHHFTLVMVDDCMSEEDQQRYLKGMRKFENALSRLTGKSFTGAEAAEQRSMLEALERGLSEQPEEIAFFWRRTRGYILQGYTSSEYFLTKVKPYQLVPGPQYQGCVAVSDKETIS